MDSLEGAILADHITSLVIEEVLKAEGEDAKTRLNWELEQLSIDIDKAIRNFSDD